MKPGQSVYYNDGSSDWEAVVNYVTGPVCMIRITDPAWRAPRVTRVNVAELRARTLTVTTPQIAIPGVSYLGPSRNTEGGEAIHRSDFETEEIRGVHYIRLYLSVPTAADFKGTGKQDGKAVSKFKDVQQDPDTGRIIISSGDNRMLWVGGGRPLRAIKWAEKYVVEHAGLTKEQEDRLALENPKLERALRQVSFLEKDVEAFSKLKNPTLKQSKRIQLNSTKLDEERKKLREAEEVVKEATAKANFHRTITNPLIRTYLFPLERFNEIVSHAVPESENAKPIYAERSFNVDRHYEPNQYGFRGADLDTLREEALPGSLITYAYRPEEVDPRTAGEVRHIDALRERLGIPLRTLSTSQFTQGTGFAKRDKFASSADNLGMLYGTWLNSLQQPLQRTRNPFLDGKGGKIPYFRRKELLDKFLDEHNIDKNQPQAIKKFMEEVVSPWASQNMIAHVMAEDYDRIQKDENVTAKGGRSENFAKVKESAPVERKRLEILGKCLDGFVKFKSTPKQYVDLVIKTRPDLESYYEKISAKSENYSFYAHAQMVLGQFLELSGQYREDTRVVPAALIIKAILFHDMEKVNSKLQYGKEGEHVLTVNELKKFGAIFASQEELAMAVALVDSDPFGDYFKAQKPNPVATFRIIAGIARRLGIGRPRLKAFFLDFHQYYQADFSSYTSAALYQEKNGTTVRGKPVFNRFFKMSKNQIQGALGEPRFLYSDEDGYEAKYQELRKLFSQNKIKELTKAWDEEERDKNDKYRQQFLRETR
ncbi:MAG: hypothetical protein ACJ8AT_28415 [Hyalangium sp.]|uniref:hypothetical protein n=1 Tax=Hyalangium sp. TaxID=2028555 RepID=UPI0038999F59